SITANNARFSLTAAATPFNIVAGTRQLVTVSFVPIVAGTQTGQLAIASTDLRDPTVNVALSATGISSTSTNLGPFPAAPPGVNEITINTDTGEIRGTNGQVLLAASTSAGSTASSNLGVQVLVQNQSINGVQAPQIEAFNFSTINIAGGV